MGRNNRKRGFTLVELIVVLVILAVLAALLVPSLTGYIDKAKKKAVITEARDVWTASQAALSECYALYPESFTANSANNKSNCRFSVCINNKWVDNVGKISNAALYALQNNPKDTVEAGTACQAHTQEPKSQGPRSPHPCGTYSEGPGRAETDKAPVPK